MAPDLDDPRQSEKRPVLISKVEAKPSLPRSDASSTDNRTHLALLTSLLLAFSKQAV
jgi:hypothetical protein